MSYAALDPASRQVMDGNLRLIPSPDAAIPTGAPTAAAGANNGTSPPAPVVAGTAKATRGSVTFGSGSSPAAGAQCVVTFPGGGFSGAVPTVAIVARNAATAALGLYVSAVTGAGFTVASTSAPAASQAATVFAVDFIAAI